MSFMGKKKHKALYAVYDKNDMYCFSGNICECAKFLGISKDTAYTMVSKTKHGVSKYKHQIYRIEED